MFTRSPKNLKTSSQALAGIPRDELAVLDRHSTLLTMAPGRVLMREGVSGREVFLVLEGDLVVERNDEIVASVGAGAVVGELALLHGRPRTATVTTMTDAALLVMTRREFASVLDQCSVLADRIRSLAAERVPAAAAA